jgi:hypothetical protein
MPETAHCGEVRSVCKSALDFPEFPDVISQHLSECDECMDVYLQAGLRQIAPLEVPHGFADRVLGRFRGLGEIAPRTRWRFPYFTGAAVVLSVLFFVPSGWEELLMLARRTTQFVASFQVPSFAVLMANGGVLLPVLFTLGAIEVGASMVFVWRLSRA